MHPPVLELLDRLSSAMHAQDLEAAVALWTDDAILAGTDQDELAVDDGIREFLVTLMSVGVRFRWEWQEPLVRRDGSIAWFYAEGTLFVEDVKPAVFRCSGVVREQHGQWRLALWHGAQPA